MWMVFLIGHLGNHFSFEIICLVAERSDDQSLLTEILISQNCRGQATNRCSLTFPIIHTNQISPINPLNT